MNSTNETLLFDRFLIMYNLCVFTCIVVVFVFHCTHVRMSYVLNSYLLTYLRLTTKLIISYTRRHRRGDCQHSQIYHELKQPSVTANSFKVRIIDSFTD